MVNAWKFFKRFKCLSRSSWCRPYDTLKDEHHHQVIKLHNGESITVEGYERSFWRTLFVTVVSVLTFLLGLLLISTRPGGLSPWLYRRTNLARASRVRLNKSSKISRIERDDDGRRWFTWQQHRFTWCNQSLRFKRVRTIDEIGLRLNDIHGLGNGLDHNNHQLRKSNYGDGTTEIARPNVCWIFATSFLKPFRIYQVAAITVWSLNQYYVYAALIALLASIEVIWKVVLKYQHQKRLHRASLMDDQKEITVLSPGQERRRLKANELVPGCVIELSLFNGDNLVLMPCDAVILTGSCLVYENGSSKPVHKYQLPRSRTEVYHLKTHRRHTLFRNSSVMLTNLETVTALVLRTGWSTEHGSILASKVLEDCDGSSYVFERHSDWVFLGLFLIGSGASFYSIGSKVMGLNESLLALRYIIPQALDLISLCLPPLLPAALFITAVYPLSRLYLNGFRFHSSDDPSAVLNSVGATDTVCLLENALLKDAETHMLSIASTKYHDWVDDPQLAICTAACHSLTVRNGSLTGSADELKMFPFAKWRVLPSESGHFCIQSTLHDGEIYRVTRLYGREALTLVRLDPANLTSNSTSWYFIKGRYKTVMEFSQDFPFEPSVMESQANLVVAFAGRPLSDSEKASNANPDLSLLARKFHLLGIAVLESKASNEARETVTELRSAGIRTLLISSKGTEEAIQLARSAGLIVPKEPIARIEIPVKDERAPPSLSVVDLPETGVEDGTTLSIQRYAHVVLNGDTLDSVIQSFPELVDQIIGRVTVLASADVHQADRFLKRLREMGRNVLLCKEREDYSPTVPISCMTLAPDGDGQERVQRGPISSNCRKITCVGQLLRQSRAALVGSLGITKVMICYAIARLTSALLLYGSSSSPIVQSVFVDLALVMLPTALYGWTRPSLGLLSDRLPAKSLLNSKELMSLTFQLVLIIVGQSIALIMAQHQPWFESSPIVPDSVSTDENYAVYSLSLFQYLTVFLVFSAGPPHRRRMWTNAAFTLGLLGLALFCSVLILRPPSGLQAAMSLKLPPVFDFRLAIFSLAVVYFFASAGLQCLIDHCTCSSTCRTRAKAQDTALESINVLYRPISLSVANAQPRLPDGDRIQPSSTALNLPIF